MECYVIQVIVDTNLPYLLAVASHLNNKGSITEREITPTDSIRIYFLDLDEENIRKRLSNARDIIYDNKELNDENKINLGIIVLFAPRNHALEITEEVIGLYLRIVDELDLKMEYVLYSVITLMIDAFCDDEKDYIRLKNMIDKKTSSETKEKFASQESILESLKYVQEDLEQANQNLAEANDEIKKLKAENAG